MALIKCAECKAKVSDKAAGCPKCGAPLEISKKKQNPQISTGRGCLIVLLVAGGIFGFFTLSQQEGSSGSARPPSKKQSASQPLGLLSGIDSFLNTHREFGSPTETQAIPDWAEGKRQRVQFAGGRNLLFYLKSGEVVAVYEDDTMEGRKMIWGSHSAGSAEYMKEVERVSTDTIPEYTVISAINLLAGGKGADVLVSSITRKTPRSERSRIAYAILKKEKLRQLSLFSTREAQRASYSDSFAKQHPKAKEGFLGAIDMDSGNFYD